MKVGSDGRVRPNVSITKRQIELAFIHESEFHQKRITEIGRIQQHTLVELGAVVPKRPATKRQRRPRRWHPVAAIAA